MTTQIEAMKLALEALLHAEDCVVLGEGGHLVVLNTYAAETVSEAITALREALAEQPAQQEPVAFDRIKRGMEILAWNRSQVKPPIEITMEQWVANELERFYTPQPPAQPLTDEQCDAIYTALDEWAKEFDRYEFGLPSHCGDGMVGGRAIIRAAAHGITKGNT